MDQEAPAVPCERHRDGVAGDPGLGAGEQALLAEQPVDQCRLARIGAPDHGDADRPLRLRGDGRVAFGFLAGFGLHRQRRLVRQCFAQGVVEVAEAFAVLRRDRHRFAEAEVEAFERTRRARPALALVGDEDGRLGGAPQQVDEGAVGRHHAGAGVDDEEHRIGRRDRGFGLGAHAAGQAFARRLFEAGGVDDGEGEIAEMGGGFTPVAGNARGVVDEREPPAGKPVEQRRLADIRPADDGDGKAHGGAPGKPAASQRCNELWKSQPNTRSSNVGMSRPTHFLKRQPTHSNR